MRRFRKIIFWLHLVVGLTVGLGVAVMAATGVALAFEKQIVARVEHADGKRPDARHGPKYEPWGVEELLARARELGPGTNPTAVTIEADQDRPVAVAFGRDRQIQLNGYTGEKVGVEAVGLRAFFHTVEELHRWLALGGAWRGVGRAVTAISVTGFFVLVCSGLWLWFPRKFRRAAFKAVLAPRLRGPAKPRDWNWHNVAGFWLLLPLTVTTMTGLVLSQNWAGDLMYRAVGDTPPRREARGPGGPQGGGRGEGGPGGTAAPRPLNVEGLNDLWASAEDYSRGWTSITMRLGGGRRRGGGGEGGTDEGGGGGRGVSFAIAYRESGLPQDRISVTYDRSTGELTRVETFADQSPGRQARSLIVPTHRGDLFGTPGRIAAAAGSLAALVLVYTGFALSYRRLVRPVIQRWRTKRVAPAAASTTPVLVSTGAN